ncbi:hypothetical protein ACP3PM_17045 [Pseudomonas iridis]
MKIAIIPFDRVSDHCGVPAPVPILAQAWGVPTWKNQEDQCHNLLRLQGRLNRQTDAGWA